MPRMRNSRFPDPAELWRLPDVPSAASPERCVTHPDVRAILIFEKPTKAFGYCLDCSRRMKAGILRGLIIGHGYTARKGY